MYTLILTHEERKAIDWVGDRYATGSEFRIKLLYEDVLHFVDQNVKLEFDLIEWDENYDITFRIPEHTAWEICDLFETEDMKFPCFSDEFAFKLIDFYNKIV